MHHLVSDHVISRLKTWRVTRVFGYSGDGDNGLMGAPGHAKGAMGGFVQPWHEEMAAFMACDHAEFPGEVGICIATSGPDAIHHFNDLYDAKRGCSRCHHRRATGENGAWQRVSAGSRLGFEEYHWPITVIRTIE